MEKPSTAPREPLVMMIPLPRGRQIQRLPFVDPEAEEGAFGSHLKPVLHEAMNRGEVNLLGDLLLVEAAVARLWAERKFDPNGRIVEHEGSCGDFVLKDGVHPTLGTGYCFGPEDLANVYRNFVPTREATADRIGGWNVVGRACVGVVNFGNFLARLGYGEASGLGAYRVVSQSFEDDDRSGPFGEQSE